MPWYASYTYHMCWLDTCNTARIPFLVTWGHSRLNPHPSTNGKVYALPGSWRLPCSLIRNPPWALKQNCTWNRCRIDIFLWRNIVPKCRQLRRNVSTCSDPFDRAVVSLYDTVTAGGVSGTESQRYISLLGKLLNSCRQKCCRVVKEQCQTSSEAMTSPPPVSFTWMTTFIAMELASVQTVTTPSRCTSQGLLTGSSRCERCISSEASFWTSTHTGTSHAPFDLKHSKKLQWGLNQPATC